MCPDGPVFQTFKFTDPLFFSQASNPNLPKTIPNLITQSLSACDPDLRQVLMGNVVLTGGGSLFAGLSERLSNELARNFAHVCIPSPTSSPSSFLSMIHLDTCANHPRSLFRSRFMLLVIPPNVDTVAGSAGVSSLVWVHSTSYGSVERSGRYALIILSAVTSY